MKSYSSHLATTRDVHKLQTPRKPVFRASAIFPALNFPQTKTRLCFLGYWKIKRDIAEIGAVVTVRDEDGAIVSRTNRAIREARAFRVELADELATSGIDPETHFRGSIEIEFFSAVNLVFPFPAVIVNYYGPHFSAVVHTAQRVFNDAEDAGENLETTVPESGFNIYADDDREPFFTFVNGFEPIADCRVQMSFYNAEGGVLHDSFELPGLRPYQSVFVEPGERVDLRRFLGGRVGAAKIKYDSRWVFPRIVAGNRQQSLGAVSVTHTYYDCSAAAADGDYWRLSDPQWHAASLQIPLVVSGDHFTNAYFYPILSPSRLAFDVEIYALDGRRLARKEGVLTIESPANGYSPIHMKELCRESGVDLQQEMSVKIIARPLAGSRMPSRIKIGVDIGPRADRLPCNICTNLTPFDPDWEKKGRTFRWAPLLADQARASLWIMNGAPAVDYRREANVVATFYREADCNILERKFCMAANEAKVIKVEEDRELADFFGGLPGWCTMVSDNPYIETYYFAEHSSGVLGGDHGF